MDGMDGLVEQSPQRVGALCEEQRDVGLADVGGVRRVGWEWTDQREQVWRGGPLPFPA